MQIIGGNGYRLAGTLSDEHIAAEHRALDVARYLFNDHERMLRETYKARMALEQTAEGWPVGRELSLWRLRYTRSCTPDGKPVWVSYTLLSLRHVDDHQSVEVLTPYGIKRMIISPSDELWEITVKSTADLPEDWMVKIVTHATPLRVEQPILCDCTHCNTVPSSIVIEDTIEEGHVLVSEAMRKIIDEIKE